jgi:uncharacterized protein (TIGR00299 family) protein
MSTAGMKGLHLHLDCASGLAGDMTLGALIDVGVPVDVIGDALDAIGAGRDRLTVNRVVKAGIAAVDVQVRVGGGSIVATGHEHEHEHEHEHGHGHDHDHVHYGAIRAHLESRLVGGVRARALDMFDRLARAEAKLHGTTVDAVAFHEVGAIDSIVDIVGTAAALDWLAPATVSCAAVAMGHGTLTCAHGVLPVPAPAALEVLTAAGGVMTDGGIAKELCTPTGASILASAVTTWTPAPTGTPVAVGWGAGDFDLADRANVVRAVVIRPATSSAAATWRIEANVDDMSPELCSHAADAAFAAGALDVWWTPITMKKGRPALMVSAIVPDAARDAVVAALLRETTTIGVRFDPVDRRVLDRRIVTVDTAYGPIRVKLAHDGAVVLNAAPEHDDCVAAATRHGVPLKAVYAAAIAAAQITR